MGGLILVRINTFNQSKIYIISKIYFSQIIFYHKDKENRKVQFFVTLFLA